MIARTQAAARLISQLPPPLAEDGPAPGPAAALFVPPPTAATVGSLGLFPLAVAAGPPGAGFSLVLAGGDVLFAGGTNQVAAFSAVDGKTLWVGDVNGRAPDLALADDRLIVSTDRGTLHCFVAR